MNCLKNRINPFNTVQIFVSKNVGSRLSHNRHFFSGPKKKLIPLSPQFSKSQSKMSSPIVQPSAFSVSKVVISPPRILDSGAKLAYLNYGDARALVMQTPSLQSPFGMNVFDKAGPPKYSLDLALRGYQENPKVKSFHDALSALDEYMIEQGVKNSKLWFKADMKREVVQAFYAPCVKVVRDKEGNQTSYPPNVKLQLRRTRDGGDFETQFYDAKSKSDPHATPIKGVPVEEMLVKKVEVTALMQCTGVWFAGGKFGLSWKAVQVRLDSVPAGLGHGPAFQQDEDEEADDVPFKASGAAFSEPAEFAPRPAQASAATDAEEDAEDEDEEVAPPPVPKKTVVTKKKVVAGMK